jgi:hypothetical protein
MRGICGRQSRYPQQSITHGTALALKRFECCRFLPQVLHQLDATGGRCEDPAVSQPLFWNILQLQVAKGAFSAAQALLATHWLARNPPEATLSPADLGLQVLLGQVDDVLRGTSVASGGTAERDAWLLNIHLLLTNLKARFRNEMVCGNVFDSRGRLLRTCEQLPTRIVTERRVPFLQSTKMFRDKGACMHVGAARRARP